MFNIHFNSYQRKELSKALFNSGNLAFATLILGPVVSDKFEPSWFIIGTFCLVLFFSSVIILLSEERSAT